MPLIKLLRGFVLQGLLFTVVISTSLGHHQPKLLILLVLSCKDRTVKDNFVQILHPMGFTKWKHVAYNENWLSSQQAVWVFSFKFFLLGKMWLG